MPLSDFIRSVLQNVQYFGSNVAPMMTMKPDAYQELQFRKQQMANQQDQLANQQDLEERKFAQQQQYQNANIEEGRTRLLAELGKYYDISPEGQGGPGLNGAGPSMGAGGGQNPPGGAQVPPQISTALGILNGMQGAPSQTPNAANVSQVGGEYHQRTNSPPTASAGGVMFPATQTALHFIGPGGTPMLARPIAQQQQSYSVPILPQFRQAFGGQDTYTTNDPVEARGIREKQMELMGKSENQKEPDLKAQALTAAIREVNPNGNTVMDVPPEKRQGVMDRAIEMSEGESGRAMKAETLAKKQDQEKQRQIEEGNDTANYQRFLKDPSFIFNKSLKDDQRQRLIARAQAEGKELPVQELKPDMDTRLVASHEVQAQVQWMHNLYKKLGPDKFGALIGRAEIGETKTGDPIITGWKKSAFKPGDKLADGTPLATLEEEFHDHANYLTQQEVRMNGGGGRAAVMLVGMSKQATPDLWKSPQFLEGAFRSTWNRAQMVKNAMNDYVMGHINDVPKNMNLISGSRFPQERVKFKDGHEEIVDKVNSDGTWHSHVPTAGEY